MYSKRLNMEIKIYSDKSVKTADGVYYSPEEYKLLKEKGGVDLDMHLVKKVFGGEVVL